MAIATDAWRPGDDHGVVDGGVRAALLLVREVVRGVYVDRFASSFLHPMEQFLLLRALCRMLLRQWWHGGKQRAGGSRLLACRHHGRLAGAMLVTTSRDLRRTTLDYLVVSPWAQGQGVGGALLDHAIRTLAPGTTLHCHCAPNAKTMKRLLKRRGFRCQVVSRIGSGGMTLPSLYSWTRRSLRDRRTRLRDSKSRRRAAGSSGEYAAR